MNNFNLTLEEIKAQHEGCIVEAFDAGWVYNDAAGRDVRALDVIVWKDEEDAENDDGTNAIERYLIAA